MSAPLDPPNAFFSALSFIGFILVLIPLYWHLEAANTGTCLFIIWVAVGCLVSFVNSRVWDGNVLNVAPVWCDISTRLIIAGSIAIPSASLCITRRLHVIASNMSATLEKRREAIIDLSIGLGLPFLSMILSYVVQGHRFDILEDVGCWPAAVNTTASYLLLWSWPIVIGAISAVYGALAIWAFIHRRRELNSMSTGNSLDSLSGLQRSLYLRLMILAVVDIFLTIPIASYFVYLNRSSPSFGPYVSWSFVHADFSFVGQVPTEEWKATGNGQTAVELTRWSNVMCAFIFFFLFGLAQEAQRNYRVFWAFLGRVFTAITGGRFERYSSPPFPVVFNGESMTAYESRTFQGSKTRASDGSRYNIAFDRPISLDAMDKPAHALRGDKPFEPC
ncbi:STE3-domain-containing protein [Artomyces pyxidatus]|uniref:STE3-domain-containing protein n=1 Tax=Artomyces pyxidatus TaxID=48021 RepID=A0ACB8SI99_9AGAM|nr:STE3-domain-containing protein [Artomyces pyxidatus]